MVQLFLDFNIASHPPFQTQQRTSATEQTYTPIPGNSLYQPPTDVVVWTTSPVPGTQVYEPLSDVTSWSNSSVSGTLSYEPPVNTTASWGTMTEQLTQSFEQKQSMDLVQTYTIRTKATVIALQHSRGERHQIVPKEVCVLDVDGDQVTLLAHAFIAPPYHDEGRLSCKLRGVNTYIVRHLHGVPWNFGEVPHKNFVQFLDIVLPEEASGINLFVKGSELSTYFSQKLDRVVFDLDEIPGVLPLKQLPEHLSYSAAACKFHRLSSSQNQNHCALVCAGRMAKFLVENDTWED